MNNQMFNKGGRSGHLDEQMKTKWLMQNLNLRSIDYDSIVLARLN
jgi:hypothetical protein